MGLGVPGTRVQVCLSPAEGTWGSRPTPLSPTIPISKGTGQMPLTGPLEDLRGHVWRAEVLGDHFPASL